jgi:4,5-DOPA dioxygenase extradiol
MVQPTTSGAGSRAGAGAPALMPVVFLGHGSPMNALADNRHTRAWRQLGAGVPRPRAVLCVSAHWFIGVTAVTAMARPRTIHDFFGFPTSLSSLEYPAPGAPDVAAEIAELVEPMWVGLDDDSWGLDHGTWSVLVHVYPDADVPVVQLSINATKDLEYHLALAARLAPLRERGVLIVGSGNVVHNLRRMDPRQPDGGFDWAHRFDDEARAILTSSPGDVGRLAGHPDFASAVPTPDHFLPLVYCAGLAAAAGRPMAVITDGYAFGSLSMTSYGLDLPAGSVAQARGPGESTDALPDPRVPPEQTNL